MVHTTVTAGFASAGLAKKLFCVLAGCAFDTLSQQRGRTSRPSVSNINHHDDLVLGSSEARKYIAWRRRLTMRCLPPNPPRLATD
jgi:hypothetical protein